MELSPCQIHTGTKLESGEEQLCAFNELINELNVTIFLKLTIKIVNFSLLVNQAFN
jgi:hypothetical protein